MEEFTLDRPDVFPAETAVGLYPAEVIDPRFAPTVDPIQTQLVGFVEFETIENEETEEEEEVPVFDDSQTAVTFDELATANYYAAAEVEGEWRFVRFAAGELGASLKPPARYPTHGV
jgi:hypothetical protein